MFCAGIRSNENPSEQTRQTNKNFVFIFTHARTHPFKCSCVRKVCCFDFYCCPSLVFCFVFIFVFVSFFHIAFFIVLPPPSLLLLVWFFSLPLSNYQLPIVRFFDFGIFFLIPFCPFSPETRTQRTHRKITARQKKRKEKTAKLEQNKW